MAGFTNKGKAKILRAFFQSESTPANVYIYLVTAADVPNADTNTLSDLTEISQTGKEPQILTRRPLVLKTTRRIGV